MAGQTDMGDGRWEMHPLELRQFYLQQVLYVPTVLTSGLPTHHAALWSC
jgi:hypothetical protein